MGGSFVAGLTVGKGQEAEAASIVVPTLPAPSSASARPSSAASTDGLDLADLRQRVQSGELSQDELTTLREQFQSQFGGAAGRTGQFGGAGGRLGGGGPVLVGTITAIEGDVLTLATAQGPLEVSLGEDVTIRQTVDATVADLVDGTRVTVVGERGDDGVVAANTIQVIPEGVDFTAGGFGGRGGFGGGRGGGFGGGGNAPSEN